MGSTKPPFEPLDENEKDYTMVTAYINEVDAAIREEEKATKKTTEKNHLMQHLNTTHPQTKAGKYGGGIS